MFRRALFIAVSTLALASLASNPPTLAQQAATERPAEIRGGSCASLGDVVAPLSPVVVPAGETQGQAGATPVEQSVTTVPLLLDELLASSYALVAYPSPEEAGTPIVCGDIGGTLASDGTLAVGLNEMNNSRYSGVAYFVPAADGSGTTVTVMLMDQRAGRRTDDAADGAAVGGGSPDAAPADSAATGDATESGNVAPAPAPVVTTPPATAGVDGVETISADNADGKNAKPARNKDKATAERDAHGNGGTVTTDGSTNGGDAEKGGDRSKREGGANG